MLRIRGATLAGMASAARLARLGHDVHLGLDGVGDLGGGRPDTLPQTFTIPALWRDLFTKTGRPLAGSAGAAGLDLVGAPPPVHRFRDGSSFTLPCDRAEQFHAIRDRYGQGAAEAWRDLLDALQTAWAARRRFGVEDTAVPTKADRGKLWLHLTLDDISQRLPHEHLATIVRSLGPRSGTDSPNAPALLATALVLDRTFGRWQLVDRNGRPVAASAMVDLLARRLRERGVTVVDEVDEPDIIALPELPRTRFLHRAPRPALAPALSHGFVADPAPGGITEVIDHSREAPVVAWLRETDGGTLATTHDHTRPEPDLAWGIAPDDAASWLRRVPVIGGVLRASACSLAGNEAWAELASSALATYELHRRVTGVDPSPRNKRFTPPPLASLSRRGCD